MHNVVFIPAAGLGLIDSKFQALRNELVKKKRAASIQFIARILRELGAISPNEKPHSISYGYRMDGEPGLFVSLEQHDTLLGKVAP